MELSELINKHYPLIKRLTISKAFIKHIDKNELQSLVNINLCKFTGTTEDHFLKFISLTIKNSVCDYRNSAFGKYEFRNEELKDDYSKSTVTQPDFELKYFIDAVNKTSMSLKPRHRVLFEDYFINGLQYNAIAKKLNMPINSVGVTICRLREIINKKHGLTYKELIAV